MHPESQHRSLQQPEIRQTSRLRVCAGGQLPAERAGTAAGAPRGLPLLLRTLAGAGGVFPAHSLGGAAALPVRVTPSPAPSPTSVRTQGATG